MKIRTFAEQFDCAVLASNASADYTQSWSKVLAGAERVIYLIVAHASISGTFNVQIASDSSGTGAEDVLSSDIALAAGKMETIEIGPGALTNSKQYVSPFVDISAGTYTLIELRTSLRNEGDLTYDSTWAHQEEAFN